MSGIVKKEVTLQSWEDTSFPVVCESCLGSNPSIRMMKEKYGSECKVCLKPYSAFRWCPGIKMRYKKTLICTTCSKAKFVCQCCILDLKYGLPVQVRDRILGIEDETPQQEANRDYYFHNRGVSTNLVNSFEKGTNGSAGKEALMKISAAFHENQKDLSVYRNMPYVCSFFLKGECNRGASCPYSHDILAEAEQNRTKIMNRYFGRKDPVAEKILENMKDLPPALYDKSITSICLHNFDWENVKESHLREVFGIFGDIKSVVILKDEKIAFVNFLHRHSADSVVDKYLESGVTINTHTFKVTWAYGKPKGVTEDYLKQNNTTKVNIKEETENYKEQSAIPIAEIPLPGSLNLKYSSMDPSQLGSVIRQKPNKKYK